MLKMDLLIIILKCVSLTMEPKTRQEKKKNQGEKAKGKNLHTSKGTRAKEELENKNHKR
jgi:hypothetical protein